MSLSSFQLALFVCTCIAVLFTCASAKASAKQCTSDSQCFPTGRVSGIHVYCGADGECVCRGCFYLQEKKGTCALDASCLTYRRSTYRSTGGQCEGHRRSKVRAILLTVFLPVGAANFYIKRYDCAVPQLVLFIFLAASISLLRILERSDTGNTCVYVVVIVLSIILSLAVAAWWIADIVIFATNSRRDGDGCPLQ